MEIHCGVSQIGPPMQKRHDLDAIVGLIPPESRVLDLGCGEGTLLDQLAREKSVEARGVELIEENVRACIGRGLSVRQGNIEEGLADYANSAFDYVVLSRTVAYLDHPRRVVREMLRVGDRAIVSFENAGYWRVRRRALAGAGFGSAILSGEPRDRAITIRQFTAFSHSLAARVEQSLFRANRRVVRILPSLCAEVAVFVLTRA